MPKLLEVNFLNLIYKKTKILHDITFSLKASETMAIIGASGSGKTSLGKAIINIFPFATSASLTGSILFDNLELVGYSEKNFQKIRGKEISFIFQDPGSAFNPTEKIAKQIIPFAIYHKKYTYSEAKDKATALLKETGLTQAENILNCYPHELSGGMKQRVMIAQALMCNPKLVIADEPTASLDKETSQKIYSLLKDLQAKHHFSILFITHDLRNIHISDKVLWLHNGFVKALNHPSIIASQYREFYGI